MSSLRGIFLMLSASAAYANGVDTQKAGAAPDPDAKKAYVCRVLNGPRDDGFVADFTEFAGQGTLSLGQISFAGTKKIDGFTCERPARRAKATARRPALLWKCKSGSFSAQLETDVKGVVHLLVTEGAKASAHRLLCRDQRLLKHK